LTIAVSTVLSAFNSLTLSPALSALLLRKRTKGVYEPLPWFVFAALGLWVGHKTLGPVTARAVTALAAELGRRGALNPASLQSAAAVFITEHRGLIVGVLAALAGGLAGAVLCLVAGRPVNAVLGLFFRGFDKAFDFSIGAYTRSVGRLLKVGALVLLVYGGLLGLTYIGFTTAPTGFIPQQDKGYLLVNVQLPDAASVTRSREVVRRIEQIALDTPGIKHTVAISGQSILLGANAPNFGSLYLMLDDFDNRRRPELGADRIAADLQDRLQHDVPEAAVNIFGAPPVEGLGTAGGHKIVVQDTGDNGLIALQRTAEQVVANGDKDPKLAGLFTSFRADTPWLELVIDRAQAKDRGVSIDDVRTTLESTFGPYYVNDFNRFGRTWQVNVQAWGDYRQTADDVKQLKVRNGNGEMVPIADFAEVKSVSGPVLVMRYNMYSAAAIHADAGPNTSSGQAIKHLADAANEDLPQSMRTEWTELALLQLQTGNTAMWVFLLAVVLVFLVLAAQYESWALPLAVILVVPMCLLCAIAGVVFTRSDVNIFTQVGFLVLVGLACKNAILIVEFAKARREAGVPRDRATLEACQLRLRPIIMTSFAFILGVVPLMLSEGAGAEMRRTLGTAVFSGMLGVTLFGIFLTPVFYYVIQWFKDRRPRRAPEPEVELQEVLPVH
ncbi:MAG: efflux RND transporter permease subunit, partial [Gemmataceae bacterium]